jgi:DNA-binding transcriptional MerR regulator
MEKSRDAFRTISEVADLLDTPAHVLRFWESRFPQVRPVKRAGGRRYYRPTDVALLSGIKRLLHSDGLTIRGVQKVLREQGIRHVMAMADATMIPDAPPASDSAEEVQVAAPAPPKADVLVLGSAHGTPPATDLPLWSAPAAPEASEEAQDADGIVWFPALLRRLAAENARPRRSELASIAQRIEDLRARMAAHPGASGR